MSKEQSIDRTWEEVIVNFFEEKISKSLLFKAREYLKKKSHDIASEKDEKKLCKLNEARLKKISEIENLRLRAPAGEIRDWLDSQTKGKAFSSYKIKRTTHLLKFSHGSSEADGILLTEKSEDRLVTTASLKKTLTTDMAHNNGAAITISRFLSLTNDDEMIFDLILRGDFGFLKGFYKTKEQLLSWKSALKGLIDNDEIKTADKTKQVYFPTENKSEYHLLAPLFSSVIAEEIYTSQAEIKYGEGSKKIRTSMSEGEGATKYCSSIFISYPNLAVQKFGGAQPQNISMLNKGRIWKGDKKDKSTWGVSYLMNAAPPIWKSQSKPPVYQKTLFDLRLRRHIAKDDIDYLRDFLIRFDRIELSIKNPKRKQWIDEWVGKIIDAVLNYSAYIQSMEPGWTGSDDIKLKREHQLFLDPYNDDESFQAERKQNAWQAVVCVDFARWLNWVLTDKDHKFSPQQEHTRMWLALMETPLREFDELVTMDIKEAKVKV